MYGGEEVGGEFVVSGGDASEVLEATDHSLDGVEPAIEGGREAGFPEPVALRRDVRRGSRLLDPPAQAVAVIALVAMDDPGHG